MITEQVPSASRVRPAWWVGAEIHPIQVAAVFAVALPTAFVSATQPLLFAALERNGQLSAAQLGQAATLELTATALVAVAAMARLRPDHIRRVSLAAAIAFAIVNLITPHLTSAGVLVARTLSGCCSGIFMWQFIGMLARSTLPARLNGLFAAIQGIAGVALSAACANLILPRYGAQGGYIALSGVALVAAVATLWQPSRYEPIGGASAHTSNRARSVPGLFALASVMMFVAALTAGWIYMPTLATQFAYPVWVIGAGMPLAVGMQIAGGLVAAMFAHRLPYRKVLFAGTSLFMLNIALMLQTPPGLVFLGGLALFGFLWMGVGPFFYSYAANVDPTRRALAYVGPSQLLGCGVGPILASFTVTNTDVRGAMYVVELLFATSLALSMFGHGAKKSAPDPQQEGRYRR